MPRLLPGEHSQGGRVAGRPHFQPPPPKVQTSAPRRQSFFRKATRGRARPRRQRAPTPQARKVTPQRHNAAVIVQTGRKLHATPKQHLSALATALVESHLRNLRHGDRDSLGLFQQRPSQGWGSPQEILNPKHAAKRFYAAAKQADNPSLTPGELSQEVQRSAYPERYAEMVPTAAEYLRALKPKSPRNPFQYKRS